MNFKPWLEHTQDEILELIKLFDPDVLYNYFTHCTTFAYLEAWDKLLCMNGDATHAKLLELNNIVCDGNVGVHYMGDTTSSQISFGRFGVITEDNLFSRSDTIKEIAEKYPGTCIIALWEIGMCPRSRLTQGLLKKTIKKLLTVNQNDIEGFSTVKLPLKQGTYVISKIKPPYQIGGSTGQNLQGKDKELHRMAGELHFLPQNDPRRREIINTAIKIKSSPEAAKYKWFTDRVIPSSEKVWTKHPYQKSAEKAGIIQPGQKWWSMVGESI